MSTALISKKLWLLMLMLASNSWAQGPLHHVTGPAGRGSKWPLLLRDEVTSITVRVEADGRHVYAADAKGRLLWRSNPFKDANLEPYRYRHPRIVFLGPLSQVQQKEFADRGRFVAIGFNSTQFGAINLATGEFVFLGQD